MGANRVLSNTGLKKVATLLGLIIVVQLVLGSTIIYTVSMSQTKNLLNDISQRARADIAYKDGYWDTSKYDSDPEIPGAYRLYVLTKDGFVIDRWRPVPGYLDTSDFKQLHGYLVPSTVRTVTNQEWRIYSLPIKNAEEKTVGLVSIGSLDPDSEELKEVDAELKTAAQKLAKSVSVDNSNIDTSRINLWDVPYYLSFQIVDQFNKIHVKSDSSSSIDRLPNYIDPSYIVDNLRRPSIKQITDNKRNETFMVQSTPLLDRNKSPIGAIITARTISPNLEIFRKYIALSLLCGLALLIAAWWLLNKDNSFSSQVSTIQPAARLKENEITALEFNKHGHCIQINHHTIPLTYATNQYYMCQALFAAPKKKWETDELIDRLGEEMNQDSWRKLYDAMNSINKKAAEYIEPRLISTSNKTYQLNPALAKKVIKNSGKN